MRFVRIRVKVKLRARTRVKVRGRVEASGACNVIVGERTGTGVEKWNGGEAKAAGGDVSPTPPAAAGLPAPTPAAP